MECRDCIVSYQVVDKGHDIFVRTVECPYPVEDIICKPFELCFGTRICKGGDIAVESLGLGEIVAYYALQVLFGPHFLKSELRAIEGVATRLCRMAQVGYYVAQESLHRVSLFCYI